MNGPKRARRQYNGWTAAAVAGLRRQLERHPPRVQMFFRVPEKHSGGKFYRLTMERLNGAIDNACDRYSYRGAWGLFIESGGRAGYHFHAWFAATLSRDMDEAIERHWLKVCGQDDNSKKVFGSQIVDDPQRTAEYLGKIWKGRWRAKLPFHVWGREGQWKPFRFHPGARKAGSKKAAGSVSGGSFFPPKNHTAGTVNPLPETDSSPPGASIKGSHVYLLHSNNRQDTGSESQKLALQSVRVGVRVSPRYGKSDALVYPNSEELAGISAHIRILAARWTVESVTSAGPATPPDCVEVMFLIPAGEARDFERAAVAPLRGFGRIFRP